MLCRPFALQLNLAIGPMDILGILGSVYSCRYGSNEEEWSRAWGELALTCQESTSSGITTGSPGKAGSSSIREVKGLLLLARGSVVFAVSRYLELAESF